MIFKVGLTGGIASGKSTVAGLLTDRGCTVVDADRIVSQLYEPGRAGHQALLGEYGPGILLDDNSIDRARVAEIAFSSAESAARLNSLIHPLVLEAQEELIEAEAKHGEDRIFVVEATLLLESGGRARFDRVIVVDLDPKLQLARAVARGMDPEDARRRMARQMPRAERLAEADYVIDNSGSLDELERAVAEVYAQLRRELALASESGLK
ncbi:MAG: dephospho-CoA kinase [Thermoanaerobaculia bacterium]